MDILHHLNLIVQIRWHTVYFHLPIARKIDWLLYNHNNHIMNFLELFANFLFLDAHFSPNMNNTIFADPPELSIEEFLHLPIKGLLRSPTFTDYVPLPPIVNI